jgi:hypothetical protein
MEEDMARNNIREAVAFLAPRDLQRIEGAK